MFENVKKRLKKDERGLTLVELLAVVVILAIVAAIAFVIIGNVIANSKKDAHISNAQQIISSVKLAESSGDVTESDFDGGYKVIEGKKSKLNTIGSIVDPWDKEDYESATVTKEDGDVYKITMSPNGPEGDKGCEISGTSEKQLQEGRSEVCP